MIFKTTFRRSQPTVCVTCVWAGWDSLWEQEKLEARKMLENPQNPTRQVHALLGGFDYNRADEGSADVFGAVGNLRTAGKNCRPVEEAERRANER